MQHILIVVALMMLQHGAVCVADDTSADPAFLSSQPVSLGNGDYELVPSPESGLQLEWTADGERLASRTWAIEPDWYEHSEPPDFRAVDVSQVFLTRWLEDGLAAVVKVRTEERADLYCLQFWGDPAASEDEALQPTASKIFEGRANEGILAVSNPFGDSIVVLTGTVDIEGQLRTGNVWFRGCPNPHAAGITPRRIELAEGE